MSKFVTLPYENRALLIGIFQVSYKIHFLYVKCKFYECYLAYSEVAHASDIVQNLSQSCCDLIEQFISVSPAEYLTLPTVTTVRVLYVVKLLVILRNTNHPRIGLNYASCSLDVFKHYFQVVLMHLSRIDDLYRHRTARMVLQSLQKIRAELPRLRSGLISTKEEQSRRVLTSTDHNDLDTVTDSTLEADRLDKVRSSIPVVNSGVSGPIEQPSYSEITDGTFSNTQTYPWSTVSLSDVEAMSTPDPNIQLWFDQSYATNDWTWTSDQLGSMQSTHSLDAF